MEDRAPVTHRKDVAGGRAPDCPESLYGSSSHLAPRRSIVVQNQTAVPHREYVVGGDPPRPLSHLEC